MSEHEARFWHKTHNDRIQCDVCPRDCTLSEGQRGMCFVRKRSGDKMVLTTYGRSSGFCVDPIEKKPLAHFYPGSSVLSFGTAGCNLSCKFCQNWDISKSREMDSLADSATPEQIAHAAKDAGCASVAFTYNDPAIFLEYAMDVADACHEVGVEAVAVTAGYMHDAARRAFYEKIDAANVDLKAFTEDFYRKITGGHLEAVKDTLRYLVRETKVWTEITTLLIPGLNDGDAELGALVEFVCGELGPDVPLHFSAFHPDYKMLDVTATPPETLRRARRIAKGVGLRHVYTGNVHDQDGDTTFCAACQGPVIERDWYELVAYRLDEQGRCACGATVAGRFSSASEKVLKSAFGRRRVRVRLATP
jgi:pyruvate formate lyase activating enzyme